MILPFTITLQCLHPATSFATPTNEIDRLALLKLKESITNDPNGVLNSWNNSIQFCNWYGITCGRHHLEALQNLVNLIILEIDENLFTSVIPTYFEKFQKSQGLFLLKNKLSGQIPSSIGNLTLLVVLDFSQNNLEGSIPLTIGNC